jgi:ADP-heptose:LPS heptosyltransferase
VDLVGATVLSELAALVEGARLVLTNNTSTMHLLDALRTPGVVLFSGTELEEQWRPRDAPHRLLRRETWCSPCYAFACPYNLECLDIQPEDVAEAGLSLLAEVGGRPAGSSRQEGTRA